MSFRHEALMRSSCSTASRRTAPEYLEAKRLLKFFDYFLAIDADAVPRNSLIKEFIGGSLFHGLNR